MQRLEVQLEDDLTGGPADETVAFGIDGRNYEIDLNERHAADFRRQLARFIERATPARPRGSRAARTAASRERSHQIRTWAGHQGYSVADRGRLPRNIIREYDAWQADEQHAKRNTVPRRPRKKPQKRH